MKNFIRILFFQFFIRPLLAFFIGVRVHGKNHLPEKHPFIIAANHSSHLDTLVLMNLFPFQELGRIRPVAASDYFMRNPIIYQLSSLFFNILPIERVHVSRTNNPLDNLRAALLKGESLIMFPEGTRGAGDELGLFHGGIAHLVEDSPQVPVIPVYLANMSRALPKGEIFLVPFICEVHIGQPFSLSGKKEQKIAALRDAILKLQENAKW